MAFTDQDLDHLLTNFDARDVLVRQNGQPVKTIQGVFRHRTEVASPHTAETVLVIPSLLCKLSDMAGVDRSHTLEIGGTTYKIYGDPDPQNSGLVRIGLVKA